MIKADAPKEKDAYLTRNDQRIILTSKNSPNIAEKIDRISHALMERDKEAYRRLANQ